MVILENGKLVYERLGLLSDLAAITVLSEFKDYADYSVVKGQATRLLSSKMRVQLFDAIFRRNAAVARSRLGP